MKKLSIRLQALMWALGAFALGAAFLVAGSWWLLEQEMSEVFEDNLKQVALAVATHHGSNGTSDAKSPPRLAQQLPRIYEEYGKFEFVTQVWSREGKRLHTSDVSVNLPFISRSGISTVTVGGDIWHLYTIVLQDGIVQSAQRASERESLSRETASGLIVPALLILAVTAGLLAYALRRGLAPLLHAAGEVTARDVEALHPIALDSQPIELRPLVAAINDLMARLGNALALQRNFAADAAHELRSPIAALRLQLPLLERASDEAQRQAALAELGAGIARAQHLVEQLLELSRVGPDAPVAQGQRVDLGQVARSVVSAFSARAEQQHVDLGAVVAAPAEIIGDVSQLTILANNLVDNALRHTPRGGRIDVAVQEGNGAPVLAVIDNGRGIAAAERDRVFDRFYRGAEAGDGGGSGLGLAIVKAIAQRHNAQVALDDAPGGGLRVRVLFPPT